MTEYIYGLCENVTLIMIWIASKLEDKSFIMLLTMLGSDHSFSFQWMMENGSDFNVKSDKPDRER